MRSHAHRQAAYRARQTSGAVRLPVPWEWLTGAQFEALARSAYQLATFAVWRQYEDGAALNTLRDAFVGELVKQLQLAVAESAVKAGFPPGAVHQVSHGAADWPAVSAGLVEARAAAATWRPQYALFFAALKATS